MMFDLLIKTIVFRFGGPVDGVHPRWLCQLVDDWLERHNTPLHERFVSAQDTGIGIARHWFAPHTEANLVTSWIQNEIAFTPSYPGLDWFRILVFAAPEQVLAEFNHAQLCYEWTGPRADVALQQDALQNMVEAHQGIYVVVNSAGRTLHYVLREHTH